MVWPYTCWTSASTEIVKSGSHLCSGPTPDVNKSTFCNALPYKKAYVLRFHFYWGVRTRYWLVVNLACPSFHQFVIKGVMKLWRYDKGVCTKYIIIWMYIYVCVCITLKRYLTYLKGFPYFVDDSAASNPVYEPLHHLSRPRGSSDIYPQPYPLGDGDDFYPPQSHPSPSADAAFDKARLAEVLKELYRAESLAAQQDDMVGFGSQSTCSSEQPWYLPLFDNDVKRFHHLSVYSVSMIDKTILSTHHPINGWRAESCQWTTASNRKSCNWLDVIEIKWWRYLK